MRILSRHPTVYGMLHDMVIDKCYRGQGLDKQLLNAIENTFKQQGIGRVYIESGLNNDNAHGFFHNAHFQTISTNSYKDLN